MPYDTDGHDPFKALNNILTACEGCLDQLGQPASNQPTELPEEPMPAAGDSSDESSPARNSSDARLINLAQPMITDLYEAVVALYNLIISARDKTEYQADLSIELFYTQDQAHALHGYLSQSTDETTLFNYSLSYIFAQITPILAKVEQLVAKIEQCNTQISAAHQSQLTALQAINQQVTAHQHTYHRSSIARIIRALHATRLKFKITENLSSSLAYINIELGRWQQFFSYLHTPKQRRSSNYHGTLPEAIKPGRQTDIIRLVDKLANKPAQLEQYLIETLGMQCVNTLQSQVAIYAAQQPTPVEQTLIDAVTNLQKHLIKHSKIQRLQIFMQQLRAASQAYWHRNQSHRTTPTQNSIDAQREYVLWQAENTAEQTLAKRLAWVEKLIYYAQNQQEQTIKHLLQSSDAEKAEFNQAVEYTRKLWAQGKYRAFELYCFKALSADFACQQLRLRTAHAQVIKQVKPEKAAAETRQASRQSSSDSDLGIPANISSDPDTPASSGDELALPAPRSSASSSQSSAAISRTSSAANIAVKTSPVFSLDAIPEDRNDPAKEALNNRIDYAALYPLLENSPVFRCYRVLTSLIQQDQISEAEFNNFIEFHSTMKSEFEGITNPERFIAEQAHHLQTCYQQQTGDDNTEVSAALFMALAHEHEVILAAYLKTAPSAVNESPSNRERLAYLNACHANLTKWIHYKGLLHHYCRFIMLQQQMTAYLTAAEKLALTDNNQQATRTILDSRNYATEAHPFVAFLHGLIQRCAHSERLPQQQQKQLIGHIHLNAWDEISAHHFTDTAASARRKWYVSTLQNSLQQNFTITGVTAMHQRVVAALADQPSYTLEAVSQTPAGSIQATDLRIIASTLVAFEASVFKTACAALDRLEQNLRDIDRGCTNTGILLNELAKIIWQTNAKINRHIIDALSFMRDRGINPSNWCLYLQRHFQFHQTASKACTVQESNLRFNMEVIKTLQQQVLASIESTSTAHSLQVLLWLMKSISKLDPRQPQQIANFHRTVSQNTPTKGSFWQKTPSHVDVMRYTTAYVQEAARQDQRINGGLLQAAIDRTSTLETGDEQDKEDEKLVPPTDMISGKLNTVGTLRTVPTL